MTKRIILFVALLLLLASLSVTGVLAQERSPQLNPGPVLVYPLTSDNLVFGEADPLPYEVTFEWERLSTDPNAGLCWYNLWVGGDLVKEPINRWYTWCNPQSSSYIAPDGVTGNMKIAHQIKGNGLVKWSVRALESNTQTYTAFTPTETYNIDFTVSGMTTDLVESRGDPYFSWTYDTRATYYQLLVGIPATQTTAFQTIHSSWYEVNGGDNKLTCGATCLVQANVALKNSVGYYEWWVRAYGRDPAPIPVPPLNTLYTGPWTAPQPLTVNFSAPDANNFNNFDAFADKTLFTVDRPSFVFNDIADATWYQILVYDPAGTLIDNSWYRRKSICGGSPTPPYPGGIPAGECNALPTTYAVNPSSYVTASKYLKNGVYKWWVRAFGPYGLSINGWVNGQGASTGFAPSHTVEIKFPPIQGPPAQVFPVGTGNTFTAMDNNFYFEWVKDDRATYYNIQIQRADNTLMMNKWPHLSPEQCGTNCQWVKPIVLPNGWYRWRIRSWGPAGKISWDEARQTTWSAWSDYFQVDLP